jgi:hypothetical protein
MMADGGTLALMIDGFRALVWALSYPRKSIGSRRSSTVGTTPAVEGRASDA